MKLSFKKVSIEENQVLMAICRIQTNLTHATIKWKNKDHTVIGKDYLQFVDEDLKLIKRIIAGEAD